MGKRSLDIVAAGFGLLALFPLLAAIAIAVRRLDVPARS